MSQTTNGFLFYFVPFFELKYFPQYFATFPNFYKYVTRYTDSRIKTQQKHLIYIFLKLNLYIFLIVGLVDFILVGKSS